MLCTVSCFSSFFLDNFFSSPWNKNKTTNRMKGENLQGQFVPTVSTTQTLFSFVSLLKTLCNKQTSFTRVWFPVKSRRIYKTKEGEYECLSPWLISCWLYPVNSMRWHVLPIGRYFNEWLDGKRKWDYYYVWTLSFNNSTTARRAHSASRLFSHKDKRTTSNNHKIEYAGVTCAAERPSIFIEEK